MTDIQVKGTVARVEYHIRKVRMFHILQDDGQTVSVQLSNKMNQVLPQNILGATVEGVATESWTPGVLFSNYLGFTEPDVQPLLTVERPIVILDSHEASTNPLLIASMRDFGFDVAESNLVGTGADLVASSRIGIQLKMTLDDLCQSVSDGRLFSELEELQSTYELPLLLIVGTQANKSHMNPASVEGSLAYLATTIDRLCIIHRPDRPTAALFIKSLVKREQVESHNFPALKQWKRGQDLEEAKQALIAQIPSVGSRKTRQLLRKQGSVEKVITMPREEWLSYIPKSKVKDVEEVLRGKYRG